MQNLLPSESVSSDLIKAASGIKDASIVCCLGFLTDQIARVIEAIIAKLIRINSRGLSEIKLIDNGKTG